MFCLMSWSPTLCSSTSTKCKYSLKVPLTLFSVTSNIQGFHGLRNVSEQEDRRFYYFYNENFAETEVVDVDLRG